MCLYRKKGLVVSSANGELAAGATSWLSRSSPEDAEGASDGLINPSPFCNCWEFRIQRTKAGETEQQVGVLPEVCVE